MEQVIAFHTLPKNAPQMLMDSYPLTCCGCQTEFTAMPSILMRMGTNSGSLTCPHCGTHLHIAIHQSRMVSEPWQTYLDREGTMRMKED